MAIMDIQMLEDHKSCLALVTEPFFPTRLLDLWNSAVRLVNGHDLNISNGGHTASSYCWGNSMPESSKKTTETIQAHREAINFALLPKTLREAMIATRSLGISFIWIDAFCIIQGDEGDWNRESATMYQVYCQAIVTIAAGLWDHCDGGFLNVEKFPFVARLHHYRGLFVDRVSQRLNISTSPHPKIRLFKSWTENPLALRGWAMQERELSIRIIYFTPLWIILEYREQSLCYHQLSRNKPRYNNVYENEISRCSYNPNALIGRCLDVGDYSNYFQHRDIQHRWKQLVMNHRNRKLTRATDKIASLSGLVDALKPMFKSEYFAGLWESDFLRGLLWFRYSQQERHPLSPNTTPLLGHGYPAASPCATFWETTRTILAIAQIPRLLTYESFPADLSCWQGDSSLCTRGSNPYLTYQQLKHSAPLR